MAEVLTIPTAEFIATIFGIFLYLSIGSLAFLGLTSLFAIGEGCFIAIAATFNAFVVVRSVATKLNANALMIIPFLIGALAFTRLTRYRWAARYTIAIISGVGAGVVFPNSVKMQIMLPIQKTVTGVLTGTPDPISAWLTFIPMVVTPLAFTYATKYSGWLHRGWGRNLFSLSRTFFLMFVGGRMNELASSSLFSTPPSGINAFIQRPLIMIQDLLAGRLELV
jgi:hypothetical protein